MIGETGQREAVLPLDNPESMARIGKAIVAAGGGGGHTFNMNIKGLVSP
jgi:hypothetical protein